MATATFHKALRITYRVALGTFLGAFGWVVFQLGIQIRLWMMYGR